jgi:glycosyltransferase involved in cell wall biosynthesis
MVLLSNAREAQLQLGPLDQHIPRTPTTAEDELLGPRAAERTISEATDLMPRVRVVLIFLDAKAYLAEAIESVRAQIFGAWELVLVDDGSTDGSTEIARDYARSDPRISYRAHPDAGNHGMSASRNLGCAGATTEYIAFLDADDVWTAAKLSEQVALLDALPDVALVCGALLYWYSWSSASEKADRVKLTGGIADQRLEPPEPLLRLYPIGPGAGAGLDCLVRRSAFEAVGGFEKSFRGLYEDQAFLAKIFLRYPVFISSRSWLFYRQHEDSCCAATLRARSEYRKLRRQFLGWLERQVQEAGVTDRWLGAGIRRAKFRAAIEPLSSRLAKARRRLRRKPSKARAHSES